MAEDDVLKKYIESQKRQKEILEETKKRRLENKNHTEPTKKLSQDPKLELKNDCEVFLASKKITKSSLDYDSKELKKNCFSFEDASKKLKEGLDDKNYLKRGLNRFEKNDFKRAINDFTRAIRINPENTDIYLVRANAKIKCENFKKAIEDLNLYLQCNSNSINALLDRGDCYLNLQNIELALKDFNDASSFGSVEALKKIKSIESKLQKINNRKVEDEKRIKSLTQKINENPMNPSFYFGRAMAHKKAKENKVYNYELAIKDLCKSIDLNPEFEDAYLELKKFKKIREAYGEKINEQAISVYTEKYELFQDLRLEIKYREALEKEIEERDKKIQNNPLTKAKLLMVIKGLEGIYSDEQIGIASGYFLKKGKDKIFNKDKFLEAKDIANKYTLKESDLNINSIIKENSYSSYFYGLCIFKDRFCVLDGQHGGTVFIPSRIVNESKDWDYSNARLKDWDVKTIINDEGFTSAFDEEDAKEIMELYSFNKPMKYIQVEQYYFLDENLEYGEWFDASEQAEFYGIRYEDCDHTKSSWCDG